MTTGEPGDQPAGQVPGDAAPRERRQLDRAPSARFATGEQPASGDPGAGAQGASRTALTGPLVRAVLAALFGAVLLVVVGAVLASTFGLLLIAGVMGAAVGLLLARAAVSGSAGPSATATRSAVGWLAIVIVLGAVLVADVATWLYAQSQGGVLGFFDFLWTTYGPFVPAVPVVAVLGAAWGAAAGPVQR